MENLIAFEREMAAIREKQAAAEEQHRTLFRRLDQQDKLIDNVNNLATSIKLLAEEQKRQGKRLDGLCGDMEEIKSKPAKRWESVLEKVLLTFAGALVSYFLAKFGVI